MNSTLRTFSFLLATAFSAIGLHAEPAKHFDILFREGVFDGYRVPKSTAIRVYCGAQDVARKLQLCSPNTHELGFRVAGMIPSIDEVLVNVGTEFKIEGTSTGILRRAKAVHTFRWVAPDKWMAGSDWALLRESMPLLSKLCLVADGFPVESLVSVLAAKETLGAITIEFSSSSEANSESRSVALAAIERCRFQLGDGRLAVKTDASGPRLTISPYKSKSSPRNKTERRTMRSIIRFCHTHSYPPSFVEI